MPIFLFISEPSVNDKIKTDVIKIGIHKSYQTLKAIFIQGKYPSIKRFLIAFFLYNDAVITIIAFASILATIKFQALLCYPQHFRLRYSAPSDNDGGVSIY